MLLTQAFPSTIFGANNNIDFVDIARIECNIDSFMVRGLASKNKQHICS